MPKLNLACGTNQYDNTIDVDINPRYRPQVVCDVRHPLPFRSESFDGVAAEHILEHIGPEYLDLMREIHRVAKLGAVVDISVPLFDSPAAWADPTHVRAFSEQSFAYFDKRWEMGADYGIAGLFHQMTVRKMFHRGQGFMSVQLERCSHALH